MNLLELPCRGGGAYGLQGSCTCRFLRIQREETTKSPPVWPSEPGYGVLKSPETPDHVFAERSGSTATCEHSQFTPGLLELKTTGVFTAV